MIRARLAIVSHSVETRSSMAHTPGPTRSTSSGGRRSRKSPASIPSPLEPSPAGDETELDPDLAFDFEVAREVALLEAHRAGDPDALGELLQANEARVYATCLKMCSDPEMARDMAQETFLRVIGALDQFRSQSRLSTWITRIAINVCLSDRRKQILRRSVSLDTPATSAGSPGPGLGEHLECSSEPPPTQRIEEYEAAEHLTQAMAQLDPDKRALLILRDGQDLDYAAIAEILGVPSGTVKSRLFRARVGLRKELERLETAAGNDRGQSGPQQDVRPQP